MDASAPLGAALRNETTRGRRGPGRTQRQRANRPWRRRWSSIVAAILSILGGPSSAASAADRYAVVITGASAAPAYAEKYDRWRNALVATLTHRFGYPDDHVLALGDGLPSASMKPTKENIQHLFA